MEWRVGYVGFAGPTHSGKKTAVEALTEVAERDGVSWSQIEFREEHIRCFMHKMTQGRILPKDTCSDADKARVLPADVFGSNDYAVRYNMYVALDWVFTHATGQKQPDDLSDKCVEALRNGAPAHLYTVGRLLHVVEHEIGRKLIHENIWIDLADADVEFSLRWNLTERALIIFPDVHLRGSETKYVKQQPSSLLVYVDSSGRKDAEKDATPASATTVTAADCDLRIENNGTKAEFIEKVRDLYYSKIRAFIHH